jgi:cellulose synthase/poly-beta-1,6-N-acetylglucosamine synthase-like glycosyltransferase
MNLWYNNGYHAVQGNLRPKNTREAFARVETLGEVFGNFVDRDAQSMLGFSSHIWGCGVSMRRDIYRGIAFAPKCRTGGFDKQMQIEMVKKAGRIGYAEEAIFYDEKIDNGRSFQKQRIRWIRSYFTFLGESLGLLFSGIRKRDLNMIYFGYNLIRPPYFLLALIALFFIALDWTFNPIFSIIWISLLGLFALSFFVIVILRCNDKTIVKGFWLLPALFFHQLLALFRLAAGRKTFLKTDHSKIVYIDELLKPEPLDYDNTA